MKTKSLSFVVFALALILNACSPFTSVSGEQPTPTPFLPAPIKTEEPTLEGIAVVQSVEIKITENSPLQVNVIARGQYPDSGCTTIASVNQAREENVFKVTVKTTVNPAATCLATLTPFEHVIVLDTTNLPPASYIVDVNGAQQKFELLTRDMTKFKQMLVEALNARNFDFVRTQMDQSFAFAYWESQGFASTPDQAIEALRTGNLSATPLISDAAKDLNVLLGGLNPYSIMGLDPSKSQALFVSGWGLDGKDEAILYMNYLLDGSLYWHGVLVAKGGFAGSNNGADTSVHETSVQYVMAQKEVTIYNGPGNNFGVIGQVAGGQIAKVTGTNVNGSWWRIVCPDDSVGSCWVAADTSLTQPTNPPHTNQPLPPTDPQPTSVQYVMALQDVTMYGGPSTQYSVIGSVTDGQTAKVTGVSADGNWWRVICPDDTIGSCWISASPSFTQPANPPG